LNLERGPRYFERIGQFADFRRIQMTALSNALGILLAIGVLATSSVALADGHGHGNGHGNGNGNTGSGAAPAPELAGKGAPAALALIAGGVAIVVSRRRRQS
jgi:hypothetical protein